MKILIIGGGGREHALAWKCAQDASVSEVFVCPGNAGTAKIAQNINVDILDFNKIHYLFIIARLYSIIGLYGGNFSRKFSINIIYRILH